MEKNNNKTVNYPVDLSQPRYDQKTFWGRFKHFLDVTDPRTLLVSDAELRTALSTLDEYKKTGIIPENNPEKLWRAKKLKDAIVHPDTNEKIFMPFRLSAFVPTNILIAVGLLTPNPSALTAMFWQWVNQSYNIALNHANRNASNPMSNSEIMKSYGLAVAVSCSIALGLGQFVKKSTVFSPTARTFIQMLVPYTAVSSASIANVFLMRGNEIRQGIEVKDKDDNVVGKSKIAGKQAVTKVAISRAVTSLPVLSVPPVLFHFLSKTNWMKNNPKMTTPVNLALITLCLFTGLPAAIALFPQISAVKATDLEPEFHNLVDKNGNKIETIYFNRGL